jgi:hypothetical protein
LFVSFFTYFFFSPVEVCIERLNDHDSHATVVLFDLDLTEEQADHNWLHFKKMKPRRLPKDRLYYINGTDSTYLAVGPIDNYKGRSMNPGTFS